MEQPIVVLNLSIAMLLSNLFMTSAPGPILENNF